MEAAEQQGAVREGVAAVEGHAHLRRIGHRQVHDHRFDEHLAPGVIELVDDQAHGRVVAIRAGDDQRVRALVCSNAQLALKRASDSATRSPGWLCAARRTGGTAEHLVQRRGHLLCDRVLQREHVNLPGLCRLRVEALQHLDQAQVRVFGSDDDQGVRLVVGDDLVQAVPLGRSARRSRRCGGRAELEQLIHALGQLLGCPVVNWLNPHVLPGAADVDLFDDAHQAPNLGGGVGDDQQFARRVDGDVPILALELAE